MFSFIMLQNLTMHGHRASVTDVNLLPVKLLDLFLVKFCVVSIIACTFDTFLFFKLLCVKLIINQQDSWCVNMFYLLFLFRLTQM